MIDLLSKIVQYFVCWIETGIVLVVNGLIAVLAYFVAAVCYVLPSMPNMPTMPDWVTQGAGFVGYFFPIAYAMELIVSLFTLWLAWFGVAIILRWAKMLRGSQ